ncbi:hypothetical protein LH128_00732 [Sphingomonas sp. LH128]|nr:hypothetical protein LH128_00732 [Sphingomonas sp. LH128]
MQSWVGVFDACDRVIEPTFIKQDVDAVDGVSGGDQATEQFFSHCVPLMGLADFRSRSKILAGQARFKRADGG